MKLLFDDLELDWTKDTLDSAALLSVTERFHFSTSASTLEDFMYSGYDFDDDEA